MGFDIIAHFYVNQNQIEQFIHNNNIDKNNYKEHHIIEKYYKETNPSIKELNIIYRWNPEYETHEFKDFYGTNFIRDDKRFNDIQYHMFFQEKYKCEFPQCLNNINYSLHTAEDALNIANALTLFFSDDEYLMSFANWLRITSNNTYSYELSY